MDNHIIKITVIRENPNVKVLLEEMQDGRQQVRKSCSTGVSLFDEEWNALCFLYNAGFSVPKPYKNDEQGMCMQLANLRWLVNVTPDNKSEKSWVHVGNTSEYLYRQTGFFAGLRFTKMERRT